MSESTYRPVTGADGDALARFLSEHHWPFHARARLGPAEAAELVAGWDLRIAEGHRGAGIGTAAVRWLSGQVFEGWPGVAASRPRPGVTTGPCGPSCDAAAT